MANFLLTHRSDIAEFTAELDFTVTAPLVLVREFLPLVRKSEAKRVLVITSSLGSIENAAFLPNLANGYSVARAALNMYVPLGCHHPSLFKLTGCS